MNGGFEHHGAKPFRLPMFDERRQRRAKSGWRHQNPLAGGIIGGTALSEREIKSTHVPELGIHSDLGGIFFANNSAPARG
jgi:hypothetical protein